MKLYPQEVIDRFGRSGIDENEKPIPIKMGYVEYIGGPFEIAPRFDFADEFSDKIAPDYGPLARVKENGKWGIIYPDGTYFIEPRFDRIHDFSEGFAAVRVDFDWGFIKPDGSYLVPPVFERVDDFHNGYAEVKASCEARGFVQPDGSYMLKSLSEIEASIKKDSDFDDINIAGKNLNGKKGYIDTKGFFHAQKK